MSSEEGWEGKTTGGCNLASALEFVSVVIKRKMDGYVRMYMNVIWMRDFFFWVPKCSVPMSCENSFLTINCP